METNKEHYAKEIIEIALQRKSIGVLNGKPLSCDAVNCDECDLSDFGCMSVKEWGNAEYHEPVPELTELEIEELTYISHAQPGAYIRYYTDDGWFAETNGFIRSLMYEYETLNKEKDYFIKDLLEVQNAK